MQFSVRGGFFGKQVSCYGVLHRPEQHRGVAVLIVNDFGFAGMCAYWSWRHLADQLAAQGIPALRIDLPGTGDSPPVSGNRVECWPVAVTEALDWLCTHDPALRVCVVGLRLGAMLALNAVRNDARVVSLHLIQPFMSGSDYVAFASAGAAGEDPAFSGHFAEGRMLAGHYLKQNELQSLLQMQSRFDALRVPLQVIDYADSAVAYSAVFLAQAEQVGVQLVRHTDDDVEQWLVDAPYTRLPACFARLQQSLQEYLAEWRPTYLPFMTECSGQAYGTEQVMTCVDADQSVQHGVLVVPRIVRAPNAVVLLFGTSANRRCGIHDNNTFWARELARAGIASLRFDATGFGDSAPRTGHGDNDLLVEWNHTDAALWLGKLQPLGYVRFGVLGLSTGGYNAFHCALHHPQVTAVMGINVARFVIRESLDEILRTQIKPSSRYLTAAFNPDTWLRLLRGEVAVKRIVSALSRRVLSQVATRLRMLDKHAASAQAAVNGLAPALGEAHRNMLEVLRRPGAQVQLLYSVGDVYFPEFEREFGPQGAVLREVANFQLLQLPQTDHAVSDPAKVQMVSARIAGFFTGAFATGH